MSGLAELLGVPKPLIGMVHLLPLPGSPRWGGSIEHVIERALEDARALATGGIDALLVENHGDVPFCRERVDAATVAAMARAVTEIRSSVLLPVGINVLKNDAQSALAVGVATGACFVRVNIHTGAVVADQGLIQAEAATTLRYRRLLSTDIKIFADVQAKHGVPLAPVDLEQEARDCASRGLADALVVSGKATGAATPLEDVKRVRSAVPETPLLVGSGVTPDSVAELLSVADGAIVGTSLKRDGRLANPVDPARVSRLVEAARDR
ncbi:MAG: BtpA/SgcQ family protein [Candidatus Methylomirabilia bacterium]